MDFGLDSLLKSMSGLMSLQRDLPSQPASTHTHIHMQDRPTGVSRVVALVVLIIKLAGLLTLSWAGVAG